MALGVNESAISRRVRDLEDQVGASLFIRHSGGVRLTLAGERLWEHSCEALRQLSIGVRTVTSIGRGEVGKVSVGLSSLASRFLLELLAAYRERHEGVCIDFFEGNQSQQIAAIRQHRLDIVISPAISELSDCDTLHLWSDQIFLALPDGHPLSQKKALVWSDLDGETFIVSGQLSGLNMRDCFAERMREAGKEPDLQAHDVDMRNLLSLVALGNGVTFVCETEAEIWFPGLVYRPLVGETLSFNAVWSPQNDNPALRRLLSLARMMSNAAGS